VDQQVVVLGLLIKVTLVVITLDHRISEAVAVEELAQSEIMELQVAVVLEELEFLSQ
jgi:hypothetical protein